MLFVKSSWNCKNKGFKALFGIPCRVAGLRQKRQRGIESSSLSGLQVVNLLSRFFNRFY